MTTSEGRAHAAVGLWFWGTLGHALALGGVFVLALGFGVSKHPGVAIAVHDLVAVACVVLAVAAVRLARASSGGARVLAWLALVPQVLGVFGSTLAVIGIVTWRSDAYDDHHQGYSDRFPVFIVMGLLVEFAAAFISLGLGAGALFAHARAHGQKDVRGWAAATWSALGAILVTMLLVYIVFPSPYDGTPGVWLRLWLAALGVAVVCALVIAQRSRAERAREQRQPSYRTQR